MASYYKVQQSYIMMYVLMVDGKNYSSYFSCVAVNVFMEHDDNLKNELKRRHTFCMQFFFSTDNDSKRYNAPCLVFLSFIFKLMLIIITRKELETSHDT